MSHFVNLHQPIFTDGMTNCAAPECRYWITNFTPADGDPAKWANIHAESFKRHHSDQFEPGRAPDISVDWEISACCSVCEDGIGDVKVNDSDSLRCEECNTTWTMEGEQGERDDED